MQSSWMESGLSGRVKALLHWTHVVFIVRASVFKDFCKKKLKKKSNQRGGSDLP